jgi:hypothetical protein
MAERHTPRRRQTCRNIIGEHRSARWPPGLHCWHWRELRLASRGYAYKAPISLRSLVSRSRPKRLRAAFGNDGALARCLGGGAGESVRAEWLSPRLVSALDAWRGPHKLSRVFRTTDARGGSFEQSGGGDRGGDVFFLPRHSCHS